MADRTTLSRRKCHLGSWIPLAVAFVIEVSFMALVLPAFVRNSTYAEEVWKDFGTASGAVLLLALLWPILKDGDWKPRVGAATLCILPLWVLGWVILQHFDFVPRWFS